MTLAKCLIRLSKTIQCANILSQSFVCSDSKYGFGLIEDQCGLIQVADLQPAKTFILHYDFGLINLTLNSLVINKVRPYVLMQLTSEGLTEAYDNQLWHPWAPGRYSDNPLGLGAHWQLDEQSVRRPRGTLGLVKVQRSYGPLSNILLLKDLRDLISGD